ncbi:tripartite motif-containing protein 2-like [Branchiostoma lanceolatum]|uniref:tripartite motif-containing protein 2-like n=1 Tax=Branchiostoma lanceolatum TaxID=7740 RepID=UPI0034565DA6
MAAAKPQSLGQHILQEELTCSICLELFTRPKVLPCQHTFCQDCLQVYFADSQEPSKCPTCDLEVSLSPEGVTCLPENQSAAKMCEKLQKTAANTDKQAKPRNRCSTHPSEDYRLYCTQCNVPVCYVCLEQTHDGHSMTSIKKATRERKPAVQTLLKEGKEILGTYHDALKDMREDEKRLLEKKKETDRNIIEAYERTLKEFERTANRLRQRIQEKHDENTAARQRQMESVQREVDELAAACERAEQEMTQGDETFLVREDCLTEVVKRYRGAPLPPPLRTQVIDFHPKNFDNMPESLGEIVVGATAAMLKGKGDHQGQGRQQDRVTFGGQGSEEGKFDQPFGVAVSEEGEIFVADFGNRRIQVFTLQGTFVRQFPTVMLNRVSKQRDSASFQRMYPHDVAMDGEGNLWVVGNTDSTQAAVQYNKQGRVLSRIDLLHTNWFRSVAMDTRRNQLLITKATGDFGTWQGDVEVFTPDGTLVRTVGEQQGKRPRYLAVDSEGNIFVSQFTHHSVSVFDRDGEFKLKFGEEGNGGNRLIRPSGICAVYSGNVVLCDTGTTEPGRVAMFDNFGRFLKNVATDMKRPWAVAMAIQGQLVVTDCQDHTVTIFHSI